ncbi:MULTISPECIES: dual specificity protein phosphatase family protein [unclassified Vibrio]|uniref:dual specificity protein phosphatase family protein n=1 Tax=unclassified Vibrio TaxID=2614977 RepID=UPI001361456A|nr:MULTISPECIES: dual specificity protein phosphatase family protein [unclassified Vibrio]NAW57528.1 phosphatase [Vibrio sp. V36_P2S2PM302]NAX25328.1 phosphatase [Vibrio sp. V38_P2S17PM301]NAX32112.1 phosphatase [Vibrio sp. V37_P2S8PM304]
MQQLFFVEESVAGRCGPDSCMWNLDELHNNNVAAILSVNDGEMVHVSLLETLCIAYRNIQLSSNAPPLDGDLELCLKSLPQIVSFIEQHKCNGLVIVHCKSGKDRTGLALAAYFMRTRNLLPNEAIEAVKNLRSIAFTAPGWDEFSLKVLRALRHT